MESAPTVSTFLVSWRLRSIINPMLETFGPQSLLIKGFIHGFLWGLAEREAIKPDEWGHISQFFEKELFRLETKDSKKCG